MPTKAKRAINLSEPENPTGQNWTQWIDAGGVAFLSQVLPRSIFVLKNHGPESVELIAQHVDLMTLSAGAVRATYAYGTVTVKNKSAKRIMIEFEFLPIFPK